jgi:hypothetical protein
LPPVTVIAPKALVIGNVDIAALNHRTRVFYVKTLEEFGGSQTLSMRTAQIDE